MRVDARVAGDMRRAAKMGLQGWARAIALLLAAAPVAWAQSPDGSIEATLRASKTTVYVGEEILVEVRAASPLGVERAWWWIDTPDGALSCDQDLRPDHAVASVNKSPAGLGCGLDWRPGRGGVPATEYIRVLRFQRPGRYVVKARARSVPIGGTPQQYSTVAEVLIDVSPSVLDAAPARGATTVGIAFSEALVTQDERQRLFQGLFKRGADIADRRLHWSNFPAARYAQGHTFVLWKQQRRAHGEGSIPILGVRWKSVSAWEWYFLLDADEPMRLSDDLLQAFGEHQVRLRGPLSFGDAVIGPALGFSWSTTDDGFALWGPDIEADGVWYRAGYSADAVRLFEAVPGAAGGWTALSDPCGIVAVSSGGKRFGETALATLPGGRWIAVIRETGDADSKSRPIYQVESQDGGCRWSLPEHVGGGVQPDLIKVPVSSDDLRLVLCVGDRTTLDDTREIGIKCYKSQNLANVSPTEPVTWGEPRMIFVGASSDLGQPSTIRIGADVLETFFYARSDLAYFDYELDVEILSRCAPCVRSATDIQYVRHRLSDLPSPAP